MMNIVVVKCKDHAKSLFNQFKELLIVQQILLVTTIGNVKRTVWMIIILIIIIIIIIWQWTFHWMALLVNCFQIELEFGM